MDYLHAIKFICYNYVSLEVSIYLSIYGIYIAPLQGNYSEALPAVVVPVVVLYKFEITIYPPLFTPESFKCTSNLLSRAESVQYGTITK